MQEFSVSSGQRNILLLCIESAAEYTLNLTLEGKKTQQIHCDLFKRILNTYDNIVVDAQFRENAMCEDRITLNNSQCSTGTLSCDNVNEM